MTRVISVALLGLAACSSTPPISGIFGTAFSAAGSDRGSFDRDLISDAIRRELGVPALAEQRQVMQQLLRK